MKITFQQVTRKRRTKVRCRVCNRYLVRVLSVMNTVNPFNKDAAGIVKSRAQVDADVLSELHKLINKTQAEGIVCRGCCGK